MKIAVMMAWWRINVCMYMCLGSWNKCTTQNVHTIRNAFWWQWKFDFALCVCLFAMSARSTSGWICELNCIYFHNYNKRRQARAHTRTHKYAQLWGKKNSHHVGCFHTHIENKELILSQSQHIHESFNRENRLDTNCAIANIVITVNRHIEQIFWTLISIDKFHEFPSTSIKCELFEKAIKKNACMAYRNGLKLS